MRENGHSLIELVIALPIIFGLFWLAYDLAIVFRDEYTLHYALFHGLRLATVQTVPSDFWFKADVCGILALTLEGTSPWVPWISGLKESKGTIGASASVLRSNEFGLWPPADSRLLIYKESGS